MDREAYDTELVEDLIFTEAEIDMLFFHSLKAIQHPQAEDWTTTDDGFETLMRALTKIQDHFGLRETDGEPVVVRAL